MRCNGNGSTVGATQFSILFSAEFTLCFNALLVLTQTVVVEMLLGEMRVQRCDFYVAEFIMAMLIGAMATSWLRCD